MLFQDFHKYFILFDVCKTQPNTNYFFKELIFSKGKGNFFDFNTSGGDMTIAMSQESKRFRKAMGKSAKLGYTSIILGR